MQYFGFSISNNEISKDAEQIIRGLLQLNPEKRLTATQVRDYIKATIDSYAGVQDVLDGLVPEIGVSDDLLSSHSSFRAMVSLCSFYENCFNLIT